MGSRPLHRAFAASRARESDAPLPDATGRATQSKQDAPADDALDDLKELFFHSRLNPQLDWTGLCLEKQHDFKFWANVTHSLGLLIMKSVFNADMPFEDAREIRRMNPRGKEGGDEADELKSRVAFVLLSGMLSNRVPGSLRLVVRSHGYQYFEHRISELMNDASQFDVEALCFNINALKTLLPYLQEPQELKLSTVCYRFLTSRFWRFMWLEVGVRLKQQGSTERSQLFATFLELASAMCYGARAPTLLKRLYASCLKSLWDPVYAVISWQLEPKVVCRVVTFVADLLLMSVQDGCMDMLGNECLQRLSQCAAEALGEGERYLEVYAVQTLDERNEFFHHFAVIAVGMLKTLAAALRDADAGRGGEMVGRLYDLSSLGTAKMTLPPHLQEPGGAPVKFDYAETRVFPRVLPCFNGGCDRVFHVDMPQLHVGGEDPEFAYCRHCGVPSYCSASCANAHWGAGHREVCGFFRAPPTFARFVAPVVRGGSVMLQSFEEGWTMAPLLDDEGNVMVLY